jgi:hypothetical protein
MKYLCIFIAILTSQAYASSFYTAEHAKEPDHLLPLDYPSSDYDALIDKVLCQEGRIATYIARPSFSPESCLVVQEEIPKEAVQKHRGHWMVPDEEKNYLIIVRRAKQSLWYSMAQNNDEKKDKAVEISESRRKISPAFAIAIQRVWARILLQTRYPQGSTIALDGTTLQFSTWVKGLGTLHGQTWSPEAGLTAELASLGGALVDFTENGSIDADPLVQRLQAFEAKVAKSQLR